MSNSDVIAGMQPVTLATLQSTMKKPEERLMVQTIRDYMPFFDRAVFSTASDGTRDVAKIITKYPEGQARGYNEGWDSEAAYGKQVAYETSMYRTRSPVDYDMYIHKGAKAAAWRAQEDKRFQLGMARAMVRRCFYGNRNENGRDMLGLRNIVVPDEVWNDRIINAGGTTADKQAEFWVINWREGDIHLTVPEGKEAPGLFMDVGNTPVYVPDKNGKEYRALVSEMGWDLGISVFNPLNIVRVTNIDTAKLSEKISSTGVPNLIKLLTMALNRIHLDEGRACIYMNENLLGWLQLQIQEKTNVQFTQKTIGDRLVDVWGTTPIYKLGNDVLSNTNPVLSFS